MPNTRPLRVFLCHASQDKPAVRELYRLLKSEGWIDPWLDEEELLPGMDWEVEIFKAIRDVDAILVCLSKESVAKEGYVQKEFKRALNFAEEKPEGTIYIIPLRLDDCNPPIKFQQWQWVDYFSAGAHEKLLKALRLRSDGVQPKTEASKPATPKATPTPAEDLDLCRFVKITSLAVQKPFWMAKYSVTNAQYGRFSKAEDYANPDFWTGFPKFDENCQPMGDKSDEGLRWLKEQLGDYEYFPREMFINVKTRYWEDPKFGIAKPDNPIVGVNWFEANAYCKWLHAYWDELSETRANPRLKPVLLRIPIITEWVAAAGGDKPQGRYPWDSPGQVTTDEKEIVKRANVALSVGHTTPVTAYPNGNSPFGVMDMVGNVWEWQANFNDKNQDSLALLGGSWGRYHVLPCVGERDYAPPNSGWIDRGFRVVAFPR